MNNIERLQKELLSNKWDSSTQLISYLIKTSEKEISIKELKELKQLAEIQLKNNVSLKFFI